jgi:penicillin-binding protein 1A
MARALADKPHEDFTPTDGVVFREIDPESGLLAREGAADAINEMFRRGTEPTQYADTAKKQKTDFYSLDQGDTTDVPKKKINPDEIDD